MDYIINVEELSKEYKVLNHSEGKTSYIKELFSRDYRYVKAVKNVNMKIKQGEIVGYLGPNGAGKSTTIKMMSGILKPSKGKILVNGIDPYRNRVKNGYNIGIVFGQRSQLWWNLPLIESYKVLKQIYHISDEDYKNNLDLFDSMFNLSKLYNVPVRQMSLGQRTLSDIFAAFLHNPKVVFLDEPTIGLDVSTKNKVYTLIKELNRKKKTTVILTTHDLNDVKALCERVIIIDHGEIIFDDKYDEVFRLFGNNKTISLKNKKSKDENQLIFEKIKENFPENDYWDEEIEDSSIKININETKVNAKTIMSFCLNGLVFDDINVSGVSFESVIRKLYDGD